VSSPDSCISRARIIGIIAIDSGSQRFDVFFNVCIISLRHTALGGLSLFGNRTKVLAETAASQIGESAQSAQKAIGETGTGEFSSVHLAYSLLGVRLKMGVGSLIALGVGGLLPLIATSIFVR
jgi:hypothetical protein